MRPGGRFCVPDIALVDNDATYSGVVRFESGSVMAAVKIVSPSTTTRDRRPESPAEQPAAMTAANTINLFTGNPQTSTPRPVLPHSIHEVYSHDTRERSSTA